MNSHLIIDVALGIRHATTLKTLMKSFHTWFTPPVCGANQVYTKKTNNHLSTSTKY